MKDSEFEFLNDLPRYEAGSAFQSKLMAQLALPETQNVIQFVRWVAPLAMAASLALGVVLGTASDLSDILSGLGLADTEAASASSWSTFADPYAAAFTGY